MEVIHHIKPITYRLSFLTFPSVTITLEDGKNNITVGVINSNSSVKVILEDKVPKY